MLTENVCWVGLSTHMVEAENPSSDCLSGVVVGQGIVALVEFGMRNGGCVHNCLIVSKHEGSAVHRNTQITKGVSQINDLLSACSRSNIL